jgi:putative glycosyl hydrolase-like family 15 (GHL15) protein
VGVARLKNLFPVFMASAALTLAMCATAVASPVGHALPALDSAASSANYSQTATHQSYVILQAWETKRMQELHSQNPALKVLVYKNLGFAAEKKASSSSTGVTTQEAETQSQWFLKNLQGERISSNGYNWLWAMDVGDPAYQQRWADNVIAELEAQGWDGVFIDDPNPTMKYAYDPSQVAKYPSDTAYSAAMESALSYIGPRIQSRGKLAIANFATWVEYTSTCDNWLQYLSGALDEMFVKWSRSSGEGYRPESQWLRQLEEVKYAASQGKQFIGFTQGASGETQAARFGYGTVLLGSAGSASYAFTPNYTSETWMPEYEYELGAPTASETRDSNGVHRRSFEKGLVLVNPTGSTQSVSFGGTYSGSGLSNATSASMPAHSALILTGSQEAAPAPEKKKKPKRGTVSIKVKGTVTASKVALTWTPVGAQQSDVEVKVYKVVRDRRPLARTSRRHRVDHRVDRGHAYRYRIVGLDRRGKVVARSRAIRVRPGKHPRKIH